MIDNIYAGNNRKILGHTCPANSEDPDQTAPKEQSDQGLHCLQFLQQIWTRLFTGVQSAC